MRIGKLRYYMTIQSLTYTQDATGQGVETWADYGKAWGSIRNLSGNEYINSAENRGSVNSEIIVRYDASIQPEWRVVYDGVTYQINAVLHDPRRVYTQLMCTSGVRVG